MELNNTGYLWQCFEITLEASSTYKNPFKQVKVRAEFTGPKGEKISVPGFWDGDNIWKVRFAPTSAGIWNWKTSCNLIEDTGLHNRKGSMEAFSYSDDELNENPNRRGFIKVHQSGRYFVYKDGTPFYWLGDTLWSIHTKRCDIQKALPLYLKDRKEKGFNVIQMVMGHPAGGEKDEDTISYNRCGVEDYTNEGGAPYKDRYSLINPEYFKWMDKRIELVTESGFAPCIMGMWGWDIVGLGAGHAKEYWRYIIARYSAYNVFWGVSGEYYFVPEEDVWREVGEEIHRFDPYGHPTSAHSTAPHSGSRHYHNEEWYDFNLIQVGHVLAFRQQLEMLPYIDYNLKPAKPTIMAESWYENFPNCLGVEKRRIIDKDIRLASYISLLQGCIGQTYGAHGVWTWFEEGGDEWNDYERPGRWEEDLKLPGSQQMKYVRELMESLRWWELAPHPELVTSLEGTHTYCTCIPGKEYMVYAAGNKSTIIVFVQGGNGEEYEGQWFDPRIGEWSKAEGEFYPYGSWYRWTTVKPDEEDWVLVLKRKVE